MEGLDAYGDFLLGEPAQSSSGGGFEETATGISPGFAADAAPNVVPDMFVQADADAVNNVYGNPTPKIGPWPECVGWQGEDCETYIWSVIDDHPDIRIIRPGIPDVHRVFVVVDEYNVVVKIPHRG